MNAQLIKSIDKSIERFYPAIKDMSMEFKFEFLKDIARHTSLFKGETNDIFINRVILDPIEDFNQLKSYISIYEENVEDSKFDSTTYYGKFIELAHISMFKPEYMECVDDLPENNKKIKENNYLVNEGGQTMSTTNTFEAMQAQAGVGTGVSTQGGAQASQQQSNSIKKASEQDIQAAKESVHATSDQRRQYSNSHKVTEVIVTGIRKIDKCVDGKNAIGTVSNPEKQLKEFLLKFGVDDRIEDVNEIQFTELNKDKSTPQDALAIYNALKEAVANGEGKTLKVYLGKEGHEEDYNYAVKALVVNETGKEGKGKGGTGVTLNGVDEIATHLLANTAGFIDVDGVDNGQVQIGVAEARGNKAVTKAYLVRYASKKEMLENTKIVKVAKFVNTEKQEIKKGLQSELVAYYFKRNEADPVAGGKKSAVFRIKLDVNQYAVEIRPEYDHLFKAVGGNKGVSKIDINDVAAVNAMLDRVASVQASCAYNGDTKVLSDEVLKAHKDAVARLVEANQKNAKEALAGVAGADAEPVNIADEV